MNLVAPRIVEGQDLSIPLLRGFSAVAAVAARKQEAERQAALDLQRIALQNNQNAVRAQHYSDMADISQGRLAVAQDKLNYDQKKDFETLNAEQNMIRELSAIKAPAGTGAYDNARFEVMSRYPEALRGVQGRKFLFDTAQDHDKQLKVRQGLFNEEVKRLGVPYDAFENPNVWQPTKDGKRFIEVGMERGELIDPGRYPYDDAVKGRIDPSTKTPVPTRFVTINDDKFQALESKYKDLFGGSAPIVQEQKVLDAQTAAQFLQQAGGDKARARQLATEQGYTF